MDAANSCGVAANQSAWCELVRLYVVLITGQVLNCAREHKRAVSERTSKSRSNPQSCCHMPENSRPCKTSKPTRDDIVVVHSSDLHIDADPGLNGSCMSNLAVVLEAAQRVGADLVLLAGDTFDSHRQPAQLVARVGEMIAAASMHVVILPGNHDPVIPEAVYHRMLSNAADNLHIIGMTHHEAVKFAEFDLEVWGRAHRSYDDMDPFKRIRARRTRWQIAMAHGHYEPEPDRSTRLRPAWLIGDAELAATRSDYVALGHWNRAVDVGNAGVPAHYSGSPDYAGTVNVVRLTGPGDVLVERESVDNRSRF